MIVLFDRPPAMDMPEALTGLISAVSEGDSDALTRIHDRTCRLIYRTVHRILRREDEAEEVTLDVYAQAWRTAESYEPSRGSVEAWLLTIARSRALDRLRSRQTRPDLDVTRVMALDADQIIDEVETTSGMATLDARRRASSLLGALRPHERALIEMAFFEGYTHGELADRLGIPLGTIKTRIRNGLIKMRRVVTRDGRVSASRPLSPDSTSKPAPCA